MRCGWIMSHTVISCIMDTNARGSEDRLDGCWYDHGSVVTDEAHNMRPVELTTERQHRE